MDSGQRYPQRFREESRFRNHRISKCERVSRTEIRAKKPVTIADTE